MHINAGTQIEPTAPDDELLPTARALAGELGASFYEIGLSDVLDMWIGSSERNIDRLIVGWSGSYRVGVEPLAAGRGAGSIGRVRKWTSTVPSRSRMAIENASSPVLQPATQILIEG